MVYIPSEATDLDSHTNEKGKTVISGTLRQSIGISALDKYPIY
jgi:hypothetical protein